MLNLYSIAGVVYDIAGAILLAEALVRTRDEMLIIQSAAFWDGNVNLYAALEEQRHDARFGLTLLVLGFLLQLFAALGYTIDLTWISVTPFATLLFAALVWWRVLAKRLAATRAQRFSASLAEFQKKE